MTEQNKHLKPITWDDLEAKDTGERGLMNVIGALCEEQRIAATFNTAGIKDDPRHKQAKENITTITDYLYDVHRISGARLKTLITEFNDICQQRLRSRAQRYTGSPAANSMD